MIASGSGCDQDSHYVLVDPAAGGRGEPAGWAEVVTGEGDVGARSRRQAGRAHPRVPRSPARAGRVVDARRRSSRSATSQNAPWPRSACVADPANASAAAGARKLSPVSMLPCQRWSAQGPRPRGHSGAARRGRRSPRPGSRRRYDEHADLPLGLRSTRSALKAVGVDPSADCHRHPTVDQAPMPCPASSATMAGFLTRGSDGRRQ